MSELIKFPPETSTAKIPAEANQIITLVTAGEIKKGGEPAYTDIAAWKKLLYGTASSYITVVVEFISTAEGIFGDGTQAEAIGLFGELANGDKFCLGLLGMNLGGVVPQIPLIQNAAAENIGFAQITVNIALYTKLSVGGLFGDITAPGVEPELTVRVRPVLDRDYIG